MSSHHKWDDAVTVQEARKRPVPHPDLDPSLPAVFLWRGSPSRPWQVEKNTPGIHEKVQYQGPIKRVLVESVVVEHLSKQNIEYGMDSGFFDYVAVIRPQRGHGYALDYAIRHMIKEPYLLKWEDDFAAEQPIDLTTCVKIMEAHLQVNQIAFNKRPNECNKRVRPEGKPEYDWAFEERTFDSTVLSIRDKWWFGPAIWRMGFVRPLWQFFKDNVHNRFNDVLFARFPGGFKAGGMYPTPSEIEMHMGVYWWGRRKLPRMTEHTGKGDSIWAGEFQKTAKKKGWKLEGGMR